jgi:rare lipoprotein A
MKTFKQFMTEATPFALVGPTSAYGPGLYGNKTASGSVLTPNSIGIAHKTLPLGSRVRLTDPRTKKSMEVPVIDRGPYVGTRQADVTDATVKKMGYKGWKEYGVRDMDVTPVTAKPKPAQKIAPPKVTQSKGLMYGKY